MIRSITNDTITASVSLQDLSVKLSIGFDSFYMTREEAIDLYSKLEKAIHQTAK